MKNQDSAFLAFISISVLVLPACKKEKANLQTVTTEEISSLTGLTENTKYHFRIKTTSSPGTAYGNYG
jgi:hypothetical protein